MKTDSSAVERSLRTALENAQHQLKLAQRRVKQFEIDRERVEQEHQQQLAQKLGPHAAALRDAQQRLAQLRLESDRRAQEIEALWVTQVALREEEIKKLQALMGPARSVRATEDVCVKCLGTNLLSEVPILDQNEVGYGRLKAMIQADPIAMFFKEPHHSYLTIKVCLDCGHAELRAMQPEALRAAYELQKSRL